MAAFGFRSACRNTRQSRKREKVYGEKDSVTEPRSLQGPGLVRFGGDSDPSSGDAAARRRLQQRRSCLDQPWQ